MTNKQVQFGFIAVGVLLLLVLVYSSVDSDTLLSRESVQLSSKQVQLSVNKSFPVHHSNSRINVKLNNPKVILNDGWEHVEINLDLNLATKKRRANRVVSRPVFKSKVTLSGALAYSPKSGNIFLKDIKLRVLNSKGVKASDIAQIEKLLVPRLQQKLNSHPIYRLKGKQFKHELNQMTLNNVEINKNNINLELALK